jgi:hypothetical protein
MTPIAELSALKGLLPADHAEDAHAASAASIPTLDQVSTLQATAPDGKRNSLSPGELSSSPTQASPSHQRQSSKARTSQGALELDTDLLENAGAAAEVPDSDVLGCDFTLSLLEVLQLILEISSPDSLQQLVWAVRGDTPAAIDQIGLLDFLETELAFCEFQRLLLRISESKTESLDRAVAMNFPLHQRLQGFLRHVLLPAFESNEKSADKLTTRQQSPEGAEEDLAQKAASPLDGGGEMSQEQSGEDRTEANAAAAATEGGAEAEGVDGDEGEPTGPRSPSPQQARTFAFWQGFDGGDLHGLEELAAPRAWPEDYELSVSEW